MDGSRASLFISRRNTWGSARPQHSFKIVGMNPINEYITESDDGDDIRLMSPQQRQKLITR